MLAADIRVVVAPAPRRSAAHDDDDHDEASVASPPRGAVRTKAATATEEHESRSCRQPRRRRRKGHRGRLLEEDDDGLLGRRRLVRGGPILCRVCVVSVSRGVGDLTNKRGDPGRATRHSPAVVASFHSQRGPQHPLGNVNGVPPRMDLRAAAGVLCIITLAQIAERRGLDTTRKPKGLRSRTPGRRKGASARQARPPRPCAGQEVACLGPFRRACRTMWGRRSRHASLEVTRAVRRWAAHSSKAKHHPLITPRHVPTCTAFFGGNSALSFIRPPSTAPPC